MLEVKYDGQPTEKHLCIAMLDSSSSQISAKGNKLDFLMMFLLLVGQMKTAYNFSEATLIKAILENPDSYIDKVIKVDMTELQKQSGK